MDDPQVTDRSGVLSTEQVEVRWSALDDDGRATLPVGSHIVSIDYADGLGMGGGRHAVGVWYAVYTSYL